MTIQCIKCDKNYKEVELIVVNGYRVCPVCRSDDDLFSIEYHQ